MDEHAVRCDIRDHSWQSPPKPRRALNRKGGKSKKIWITEIGWPVIGNRAEEDHSHFLVNEGTQEALLNRMLDMIKKRSGERKQGGFEIENVFYYNIEDWVKGSPHPHAWDYHSGLREENSKMDGENGEYRKAWCAFQDQAHYEGSFGPEKC